MITYSPTAIDSDGNVGENVSWYQMKSIVHSYNL
jgi:hypothetical protein